LKFFREHKFIPILIAVLVIAMALVVFSLLSPGSASAPANLLGGVMHPAQEAVAALSDWLGSLFGDQEQINELLAENMRLRAYAAEVEEKARLYDQTLAENERLRELLNFAQTRREFTFEPATVVSRDLDNYSRTCTLSKGSQDGVTAGMAAVSAEGYLIGVVSEVGTSWCTLRTVIDADFACGAYAARANIEAVCEGSFELMRLNRTSLSGISREADVKNGDIVLTSGVGGTYPRDIEIGRVADVTFEIDGMTATAVIEPMADLARLSQVFLITGTDNIDR
jgi:rod shape-determining protein MreC